MMAEILEDFLNQPLCHLDKHTTHRLAEALERPDVRGRDWAEVAEKCGFRPNEITVS